ncbi:heme-binding protein [Pseudomonas sp. GB2N2]
MTNLFTSSEALVLAEEVIRIARVQNRQVGVAVLDHTGKELIYVADDGSRSELYEVCYKKAFTAHLAQENTLAFAEKLGSDGGVLLDAFLIKHLVHHDKVLFLSGGDIIKKGNVIAGAVGASGAGNAIIVNGIVKEALANLGLN